MGGYSYSRYVFSDSQVIDGDHIRFRELSLKYDMTNQYCWFHVMEHQSSHLGQILFLKKRIPPEQKEQKKVLPQEIKK